MLSLAIKKKWSVKEMDVKIIFLNGILKKVIYLEILLDFKRANDPN